MCTQLCLCWQASHPLLDVTFSEESSDEEYNPATDMSEGESEGEESEEGEWGGTPSWDPKAPQIEEKQEARTQITSMLIDRNIIITDLT